MLQPFKHSVFWGFLAKKRRHRTLLYSGFSGKIEPVKYWLDWLRESTRCVELTAEANLVEFQMTPWLLPFENFRYRLILIPLICIYSRCHRSSRLCTWIRTIDQSSLHHVIYWIYYNKQMCVLLNPLGHNLYLLLNGIISDYYVYMYDAMVMDGPSTLNACFS